MNMKTGLMGAFFAGILLSHVYAAEGDLIASDRQALAEARTSGVSSKIIAAKEQLADDLWQQQEQKRKELEGTTIPLIPDDQGHLLADVLINNKVHTTLIVDTGSPVILLNAAIARQLGLDLSHSNAGYVEVLNGKHKVAAVTLDSIKIGTARLDDVGAAVMIDDNKEIKYGILGMSFLSKFHFTLDQAGQKLILKKNPAF